MEVKHGYVLTQGSGQSNSLVQISRAKGQTKVYAYSVKAELEAKLDLARKMGWARKNELAITMRHEQEQQQ